MIRRHQKNICASEISSPNDFLRGLICPLGRDLAGISATSALGANSSPGSMESNLPLLPSALRVNASWKLCDVLRSDMGAMYDLRRESLGLL